MRIVLYGVRAECEDALERLRSVFDVVRIEDPYTPPGSLLTQMHVQVRFGPREPAGTGWPAAKDQA